MLNLLDGGPGITAHPEEFKLTSLFGTFFSAGTASGTSANAAHDNYAFALENAEAYRNRLQDGDFGNLGEAIEHDLRIFSDLVYKSPQPTKLFVVKDVGRTSRHVLTLFRHLFLNSKIVSVMRNPRMVTRPIVMDRRRRGVRIGVRRLIVETLDPMLNLRDQVDLATGSNIHSIKYEEPVSDVARTMEHLAEFLGISFSEIMTRPTVLGEESVVRTSSQDTAKVFASSKKWYQDITLHEIAVIFLASLTFRTCSNLRRRPIPRHEEVSGSRF